jgi:hypothetical protein
MLLCERNNVLPGFCALSLHHNRFGVSTHARPQPSPAALRPLLGKPHWTAVFIDTAKPDRCAESQLDYTRRSTS